MTSGYRECEHTCCFAVYIGGPGDRLCPDCEPHDTGTPQYECEGCEHDA